jgi:hypothetical protein
MNQSLDGKKERNFDWIVEAAEPSLLEQDVQFTFPTNATKNELGRGPFHLALTHSILLLSPLALFLLVVNSTPSVSKYKMF